MDVRQDYLEFVASLNAHQVKYLIVGAHAVGFHAIPRYSKDIDFWIESSPTNGKRFLKAVQNFFTAKIVNLSIKDLCDPKTILQFGVEPGRIDVITSMAGVAFKDAWKKRISSRYGSEPANYLSLDDLIKAKKAAGREQDIKDLKLLLKVKKRGPSGPLNAAR